MADYATFYWRFYRLYIIPLPTPRLGEWNEKASRIHTFLLFKFLQAQEPGINFNESKLFDLSEIE